MKIFFLALTTAGALICAQKTAQTRVFIAQTQLSRAYLVDHIQKTCPNVVVTITEKSADFAIIHEYSPFGHIILFNKSGDVIQSISAKRPNTLIRDLCSAINSKGTGVPVLDGSGRQSN